MPKMNNIDKNRQKIRANLDISNNLKKFLLFKQSNPVCIIDNASRCCSKTGNAKLTMGKGKKTGVYIVCFTAQQHMWVDETGKFGRFYR